MTHVRNGRNRSAAMLLAVLLLAAAEPTSLGAQSIGFEAQATAVVEVEEGENPCIKQAWATYNACLLTLTRQWVCDVVFMLDVIACAAESPPKAA